MLEFVFVLVLLSAWWWSTRRHTGLPPSPGIALPVVGHLYLMEQDPTRLLQAWRKKLGNVFSLKLGSKRVVFINGYDVIHEALVKQHSVFMNRSDSFIHHHVMKGKGVASLKGEEWKVQRTLLRHSFRSMGIGKNVMAERISIEIKFLLDALKELKGEPTDVKKQISACVSNIVCNVTTGRRFDYQDPFFLNLQERLAIKHVDASFFPEIQDKLYEEMKNVVGTDTLPNMSHKSKLKYLNAFIFETQRFGNVSATGLDRTADVDTTLNGYFIPKGSLLITVFDSLFWDDKIWGDAMTFRPERFLENGELTVKKEFLPFSVGRRNCVGESLAVMERYLIIAALVHTFHLLPEDPNNLPTTKGIFGLTRTPHTFKVRAVLRGV
ncbi:cytochrome P450 2J1-like [Physella acuta]|uniref:cytochrome P450 2J1-like n=1 Tax=Physella acuta TaxID=109671 RepID=UPI0027DD01EB|nr:cytochrome P450 2J1-like [Physella acuta]